MLRRYPQIFRRFTAQRLDFGAVRRNFYRRYWSRAAETCGAELHPWGNEVFEIRRDGGSARVQYHFVHLDSYFAKALVDDKRFTSELVDELGFATPQGVDFSLRQMRPAREFLERAPRACVVKPQSGSGGRGVTTGVDCEKRLVAASLAASNSFTLPSLMIEEQIPGDSFRLLFLGGRLIDAVRRGACTLEGDGRTHLKGLVAAENERRHGAPHLESMEELTLDLEAELTLADQGLDWRVVPGAGERIVVKRVSNQNTFRDQEDVTALVHDEYGELAREVDRRIGAKLIGVDVMSEDISKSPKEGWGTVNEINIPPGLHFHEMTPQRVGRFSKVGASVVEYLLGALPRGPQVIEDPSLEGVAAQSEGWRRVSNVEEG